MKKSTLFYLILSTLFLIACGAFSPGSSKPAETDFHVGTEALRAEFLKNAPPQIVMEKSNFPIFIKVRNYGAYDIKDKQGVISVAREKDYVPELKAEANPNVNVENNVISFDVLGKSLTSPKGEEIFVNLIAKTGSLDPQSETKSSTITATLCYPYQTVLSATVCIDPDFTGTRPGKKVCTLKELSFSGQGAPITVTRIEPQMVPDGEKVTPQFLIYVENKGPGNPTDPLNYKSVCDQSQPLTTDIWNVAHLKAYSSDREGENQLLCAPDMGDGMTGKIKFRDKRDFVRCTFKEPRSRNDDAYTSPLRVVIDYGYVQSIATNFEIKKPLKY